MKISTNDALIGELLIKQFKFETYEHANKHSNIEYILRCLDKCNKLSIPQNKWYRARTIKQNDPDIIYDEHEIPMRGYLSEKSGVAPAQYTDYGRANDKFEQVLYVAEDEKTAQKEVRANIGTYVSIASCKFTNNVTLIDFSPYTESQLSDYPNANFADSQANAYIFIQLQRILTMPEYSQDDYIISRNLVKLIKENIAVSGMIYISRFTGKRNIAIWDEHKYAKFTDGYLRLVE